MLRTRILILLCAIWLAAVAGTAFSQMADKPYAEGVVDSDGAIRVPDNFRTDYVMLGAWSVAGDADTGGGVGLHVVYAPRAAVDAYRRTGAFPDGTVLVKELFNGKTEALTTGEATSAASTAGCTNPPTSPPMAAISRTRLDEMNVYPSSGVRNIVSMPGASLRFMLAS